MGDKDLENLISSIGEEEVAVAQKQAQIDRLKQLIVKQKNEMGEQQKIIEDLQNRMQHMYDLPADVEELKRMVGEQRSDINTKDQQLEMAFAKAAEFEAEAKNTNAHNDRLSTDLDSYISQIGELKAKIMEQTSLIKFKEKELAEVQAKWDALQANYAKIENEYSSKVGSMTTSYQDNFESLVNSRKDLSEKVTEMEAKMLDYEIKYTEANQEREQAVKIAENLKGRFDELMAKIEAHVKTIAEKDDQMQGLLEFRNKNENAVVNLEKLMELFEHEPMFKMFNVVHEVGVMKKEMIQSALGVPKVTTNKYIEQFKKVGIFDEDETGKIRLRHHIEK